MKTMRHRLTRTTANILHAKLSRHVVATDGTQLKKGHMPLKDLQSHAEPYVTVAELAEYWLVGRKQIYKQIDGGTLPAIRLGPRLLRIRTSDARTFERSANMRAPQNQPQSDSAGRPMQDRRRA